MIKTSVNSLLVWIFLIFMSLNFLLSGLAIIKREALNFGDEDAYLETAINVKSGRGFVFYGKNLFNQEKGLGYHPENNRQPLYIMLLSIFAQEDESFRLKARVFTLTLGLIFLWIFLSIGKEIFDLPIALGALFLLSVNSTFVAHSAYTGCEILLSIFTLLSYYYTLKGFKDRKYCLLAGAFAGLAYLTKGSGTLIVMAFCLSSVIIYKWRVFKDKYFYLYLLAFLAVSSPLLVRNITQFHKPFYDVNTIHVFWGGKGMWLYLTTTPIVETLYKIWDGIFWFSFFFFKYLSMPFGGHPSYIWNLTSIFILVLFFLFKDKTENREGKIFTFSLFATFYLLFSWFCRSVQGYSPRYILPIFPMIFLYSMEGMRSFAKERNLFEASRKHLPNILILLLTICLTLRLFLILQRFL
ncbi:glycosyltransferase family 39 protein [bacterium]|nr:glycosyltransferase family 39 protein [bacterium]